MNAKRFTARIISLAIVGVVSATSAAAPGFAEGDVGSPLASPSPSPSSTASSPLLDSYGGDPQREAELVAQEDRRLIDVDLVASGTMFPGLDVSLPFRVAGEPVSTLVLPARDSAYTENDLLSLAPQSFVATGTGEYLLSEHVVVLEGATLDLRRPGGLVIKLASQDNGFVSIVIDGGNLVIDGTPTDPVTFQGWDAQRSQPDTSTADGRAYVRVMGGYASITNASFSDLGFWSGLTGGLSLTGTTLASTLGLTGDGQREIPEAYLAAPADSQTVEPGKPLVVDGTATGETGVGLTQGTGLYSNGVTAWLSGIKVTRDAYGLFVSDATSIELQNSKFTENLVDGVVFHREVLDSHITGVVSSSNGGDGFKVTRGSQGVLLDTVVASNNKGNGITIDAAPLAEGPSATGQPVVSYGGHSVLNSKVTDNGHYGIQVLGGDGITLRRNTITGSDFGIMVGKASQNAAVEENRVNGFAKQGIAFKDGSQGKVWGNLISGGDIAIFARDSTVDVSRNTIEGVSSHGVTMVGDTSGSTIAQNLISGHGNSPIDTVRGKGVSVSDSNKTTAWVYENITERVLRVITKPMTMLWTALALLLLLTAFKGFRYRGSGFGNPYRDRTPLVELSRGIVDPSTVPGVVRPIEFELRESQSQSQSLLGPGGLPRRRATDREQVTA